MEVTGRTRVGKEYGEEDHGRGWGPGRHSRVSSGSGELGSLEISPSPHTYPPNPPHPLPLQSAILVGWAAGAL